VSAKASAGGVRSGTSPTPIVRLAQDFAIDEPCPDPEPRRGDSPAHEIASNQMLRLGSAPTTTCKCSTVYSPSGGTARARAAVRTRHRAAARRIGRGLLGLVRAVGAQGQRVSQGERPGVDHPWSTQPHVRIDLGCGDSPVTGAEVPAPVRDISGRRNAEALAELLARVSATGRVIRRGPPPEIWPARYGVPFSSVLITKCLWRAPAAASA
jgi:hypothetical protein